jgi:chromosome partitioning protein
LQKSSIDKERDRMSSQPRILVVANGKGGVGKTTTTMALSAEFADNYKVLAVDADPQQSLSWWAGRSEKPGKFEIIPETDPQNLRKLRKVKDYDLLVIDTPPALGSETLGAVLAIADYLVLPTPCAPMDLAALIATVQATVIPKAIPHRVILTKVDVRSLGEAWEAQNTLRELGIATCHTLVRGYKAHEKAAIDGLAIAQWRGKNAKEAAKDYRSVAKEIESDWRK